ncbi:28380_t:CDS:2, partial [Racocetra persica]
RAKEVTQDAKEQLQDVRDQLKIHQDALVGAQAEALQVLRTQQDDKLRSDASHFATAHALNTYVLAVSVAIEKVRKQKLDQTKKDILAGLENNFLQDATIKDADINQEINKLMGAGFITGTDNWKKLFEKEDNRIDGYENFTWTATM